MKVIQGRKVEISYKIFISMIMVVLMCLAVYFALSDTEPTFRSGAYSVLVPIAVLTLIMLAVILMITCFMVDVRYCKPFGIYCQKVLKLSHVETETKREQLKQQSIAIFEHANRFKPSQKLKLDYLFSSTPYRFTLDEKIFVVDRLETLGLKIEVDNAGVLHYSI